jgi:hypothetical protein
VLGLIYIFIVAKPISIRRLSLLFVVTLVTTDCVFGITHIQNSQSLALATAITLTAIAWLTPLGLIVGSSVKARRLVLDALDSTSALVQVTYGSVLATLLLVFPRVVNAIYPLTLGILLRTWIIGGLIGLVLFIGIKSFSLRPISGNPKRPSSRPTKSQNRTAAPPSDPSFSM